MVNSGVARSDPAPVESMSVGALNCQCVRPFPALLVGKIRVLCAPWNTMFVFGDSTVDCGNNNNMLSLIKANQPPYGRDFFDQEATGRFSNGRIATDFIAARAGLPYPLPYLRDEVNSLFEAIDYRRGVNFASAGAGWMDDTAELLGAYSLTAQTQWFRHYIQNLTSSIGSKEATSLIQESIYFISTGSNDYMHRYLGDFILQMEYTPEEFAQYLASLAGRFIQDLHKLGARRIAVVTLPPLGCIPFQRAVRGSGVASKTCVEDMNKFAQIWNSKMETVVSELGRSLGQSSRLVVADVYTPILEMYQDPELYGFRESLRGCCGTGGMEAAVFCNPLSLGTCPDASIYLFWDSFHLTQEANLYVADHLLATSIYQLLAPI